VLTWWLQLVFGIIIFNRSIKNMLTKALILFGLLALAQGYSFTSREVKCHGEEITLINQQQAAVHLLTMEPI